MKFTVGSKISDDKPLKLDAAILADTRALLCASSGGGKSRLLRLIAELVGESIQTIIIDPEGEFATLREKLDILIVGENGDVQANVKSAGILARRLAETGVSAVLDIYDLPGKGDPWDKRREFVAEFLTALMNLPKTQNHPMLIIVDEAHQFAPEGKGSESATASRSAINSLMSAGRKRGFGGILATQRISKIHKDSIADARNIFIGGTTLDIDQERAGDMLGMSKKESVLLRDLAPGQFYCYGPATGSREIFQFISGEVQTTHPKAGQRTNISVPKASTKIAAISEKLGDLPTEAQKEVDEIEFLKRENNRLQREMAARPVQIEPKVEYKEVEVPVIKNEQLEEIRHMLEEVREINNRLAENAKVYSGIFTEPADKLQGLQEILTATIEEAKLINQSRGIHTLPKQVILQAGGGAGSMGYGPTRMIITESGANSGVIKGPEQKILNSIAWFQSIGNFSPLQTAVAFLAGYSHKSKTYTNPRATLKGKGLVEYRGNCIALTTQGQILSETPSGFLTAEELQSRVLEILPGPERKILKFLLGYSVMELEKFAVAQEFGYEVTSKTFTNPLSRLRSLGLVDYPAPKMVRAMPFLFLK